MDGALGIETLFSLRFQGEVDHHDGVLFHDADEQDDADERDDAEFDATDEECEQGTHASRGKVLKMVMG